MDKLTIFYLEHCPYCRNAKMAVKELYAENPTLQKINIEWVEERQDPERAEQYDYYYVPSVFLGSEKLYECSPADDYEVIKQRIWQAMDKAIHGHKVEPN